MNTSFPQQRVAIIGGGTAGVHAASVLQRLDIDLTIVEPTGTHQFLTRLVAVAGGTQPASDASAPIEGLDKALPLRSTEHALAIRERLSHSNAVVVVGGGATGCQLAGAIARTHRDIAVTHVLTSRGVNVVLDAQAEQFGEASVVLSEGETLDGTVIWTRGFEASMQAFGPTSEGRLDIDAHRPGARG